MEVTEANKVGDYDTAAYRDEIPWLTADGHVTTNVACSWTQGTASMDNPFGWGPKSATQDDSPFGIFAEDTKNHFMITEDGTFGVRKLYRQVIRYTNGDMNASTISTNDWMNIEGTNIVGQTDGGETNGSGSATGPLMSAPAPSECRCWSGSGATVLFSCSDNCGCGGDCHATGTASMENF